MNIDNTYPIKALHGRISKDCPWSFRYRNERQESYYWPKDHPYPYIEARAREARSFAEASAQASSICRDPLLRAQAEAARAAAPPVERKHTLYHFVLSRLNRKG